MSEQKHFKYDGSFTFKPPEVKVTDVKFLIPITVKYTFGTEEHIVMGQIDYANKEVYFPENIAVSLQEKLKENTLAFLNQSVHMDPGTYAADDELMLKAEKMKAEYEEIQDAQLGETTDE